MAIFTKQEFEAIALNKARKKGLSFVNESRTFSANTSRTSVFLSHSHTDRALIAQAKTFFEDLGISIYVDWADTTMPERTNGITAQNIKRQIANNERFVLLATDNAINSKWCNWEVGIGDAYKLPSDQICILPLADNGITWQGNEYLQIYPRIEKNQYTVDSYRVIYPDGRNVSLNDWLNK